MQTVGAYNVFVGQIGESTLAQTADLRWCDCLIYVGEIGRYYISGNKPESNRISVWVKTEDGKTDVTYPDLPYVAWMDHDGDFSWNSNNYVHGPTARIKPRK